MLEGKNISFGRGEALLFSSLSFSLKKGEELAIKGANGSGKSTFLRLLAGFMFPKSGTLFWEKERVSSFNLTLYQQSLLYVGHKLCLHPEARVRDQLYLWQDLYRVPKSELEKALSHWGLSAFKDKKISHLSQGQQKRLSLSRCSWLKRSLWILDEPEAGLDQEGQGKLGETLLCHLKRGGCIVHATHNPQPQAYEILL